MKRTDIDFSKHQLDVVENDGVVIHHLKQPDTVIYNVKFTNIKDEGMVVTGDFGNWYFSRNFVPKAYGEKVSDLYWIEKLEHNSTQSGYQFDSDQLDSELEELRSDCKEYIEYDKVEDFINAAPNDNEIVWQAYMVNNKPSCLDYEKMPEGKVVHPYLLAIFDAYDEIVMRFDRTAMAFE